LALHSLLPFAVLAHNLLLLSLLFYQPSPSPLPCTATVTTAATFIAAFPHVPACSTQDKNHKQSKKRPFRRSLLLGLMLQQREATQEDFSWLSSLVI
jgi:hypothetical protein